VQQKTKIISAAAGSIALLGTFAVASATSAAPSSDQDANRVVTVGGQLNPLNNSGAEGHARVNVRNMRLHVAVDARGVVKGVPHAMHVHFGKAARNECPNVAMDDTNGDFRLETLEGAPAYGPVRASLTTRGDTSPASVLAIDRFPTAPRGMIHYDRTIKVGSPLAHAVKNGRAVVVIHGVDYNGNGTYDSDSAGQSDLDPSLPAEATDPAVCGILHN
jgi:hypothetical protein